MVGIVKAGFNWIYSWIPSDPTNRAIVLTYFSSFLSDSDRDAATIASLGLKGRLSQVDNPFVQWIKKSYPEDIKKAETALADLLFESQWPNLCKKVLIATAFYFTRDLSFYGSLTNLLSHSEKISTVAQPILDKVASLPIPYLLQATRVIAFAPVLVKLIHMTLIWVDPKGETKALEMFKTVANETSRGLELLWNLRFSLLCLGISKTIYTTVFTAIIANELIILFLLRQSVNFGILNSETTATLLNSDYFQQGLSILRQPILANADWPTFGFNAAVTNLLYSFQAPSDPSDIEALENLFNEANSLTGTLVNLATFQASIETVKSNIFLALKERKISENHVKWLHALLNDKMSKTLSSIVLDSQFETKILEKEFLKPFKATYCQKFDEDQTNQFIQLLKDLKQTKTPPFDFIKDPRIAAMNRLFDSESTLWLRHDCATILWPTIKSSYETIHIPLLRKNLPYRMASDLKTWKLQLKELEDLGCSKESVNALRSEIFKSIQESYPKDLELPDLLTETHVNLSEEIQQLLTLNIPVKDSLSISHEKQMIDLFGKDGLIHSFAITKEEQDTAYLLSAQFQVQRFELNLNWYLENPPIDQPKRKELEYHLFYMANQAKLDFNTIEQSLDFGKWKSTQSQLDQNVDTQIVTYLKQSNLFAFARTPFTIPVNFKFETIGLPITININKSRVNPMKVSAIPRDRFPAPWCNKTRSESIQSELTKALKEDTQKMLQSTAFLSSLEIQKAASK